MIKLFLIAAVAVWQVLGDCGNTPITPINSGRIVGGETATPYSWPWQIEFCRYSQNWWGDFSCDLMCGGSVISNGWVVTAGHCAYGNTGNPGGFRVKVGVYDEEANNEAGEQVLEIAQIILHPQYDSSTTSHDIALLKLKTPITFTNHIQPVCLAAGDTDLTDGSNVVVTGWGTTSEGGDLSSKLKQVAVPMVNMQTCISEYAASGETVDPSVMFCAGVGGKDSCQGDSGGPVVKQSSGGQWKMHGIVSWGYGCARAGFPGVYSRVSAYCDFVKQNTGVSCV